MKDFAESFYKGTQWQACRAAYISYRHGLCEACQARGIIRAGIIVHHKKHVDVNTIKDPAVLYGFDNLQLLCRDCHADAHRKKRRYTVDQAGRITCTEV